jgi:hypothetical protein
MRSVAVLETVWRLTMGSMRSFALSDAPFCRLLFPPEPSKGSCIIFVYTPRVPMLSPFASWTVPSDLVSCRRAGSAFALLPRLATSHCSNACKSSSRGLNLELPIWLGKAQRHCRRRVAVRFVRRALCCVARTLISWPQRRWARQPVRLTKRIRRVCRTIHVSGTSRAVVSSVSLSGECGYRDFTSFHF